MSQQKLKLGLAMTKQIPPATAHDLFRVKTAGDAWRETFLRSGRPRKKIVAEVGINNTTLTMIFQNERTMPEEYRDRFLDACGNEFYEDWRAFQRKKQRVEREITPEEELHQLRQENARLYELAQRSA